MKTEIPLTFCNHFFRFDSKKFHQDYILVKGNLSDLSGVRFTGQALCVSK